MSKEPGLPAAEQSIVNQHILVRLVLGAIALWLTWKEPLSKAFVGLCVLLPLYLGSEALLSSRLGWLKAAEAQRRRQEREEARARLAAAKRQEASEKYFDLEDGDAPSPADGAPPAAPPPH